MGRFTIDPQQFLEGMSQAAATVSITTTDGKALLVRPIADDIGDGRVILRQPGTQGENPHVAAFSKHCQ